MPKRKATSALAPSSKRRTKNKGETGSDAPSAGHTTDSTASFRFFDLPQEVRCMVYSHLFGPLIFEAVEEGEMLDLMGDDKKKSLRKSLLLNRRNLLLVNKQVSYEVQHDLARRSTLRFSQKYFPNLDRAFPAKSERLWRACTGFSPSYSMVYDKKVNHVCAKRSTPEGVRRLQILLPNT